MMAHHRTLAALLITGLLIACDDNPPVGPDGGQLTVEFAFTPDHVHILQSEVVFTVTVTDENGGAVTDFEALEVQRRAVSSETWRGIEMTLSGDSYEGTYVFSSSGDYELRVAGQRPGDADLSVLYEVPDLLHTVRAHAEAGGYRVEFESFPGHIHEGDEAELGFWVMETERDASGERPPITGLTGDLHVIEAGGFDGSYTATEGPVGIYGGSHTFTSAGAAHAGLHFTGLDGQPAEASFDLDVVHAH